MQLGVIDIGGTFVKYAAVDEEGAFLFHGSVPTEAAKGGEALVAKVQRLCDELMGKVQLDGISISSAGQIDNVNGRVVFATDTLPGYTGTELAQRISAHTGLPAYVENDVNCTALGEYWKGAARGTRDFLCVTIGTGIGGALFLNGELYTGSHFSAGEIGHINLYPNGTLCTCGQSGCYEQYASSLALQRRVTEQFGEGWELKAYFEQVKAGNREAVQLFEHWLDDLTTGLQTLVHLLNPELIVIGGGISAQGDFLQQTVLSSLENKIMPNHRQSLQIKMAEHDNKSNLLGAAKNFLDKSGMEQVSN
ncbi:ROK family protein [Planococcus glaciei]|uniref:ROK family protein n=1 Tax=Planococcus glaciei TaxID=459472 RepID=A0A7H8Q6P4_9BACL|nr:ROK family protein [Planococcus glaciei]QKX49510.1 ROK family protein [Planococcus glaciei]